jgi:hypothetical protein
MVCSLEKSRNITALQDKDKPGSRVAYSELDYSYSLSCYGH